ncbi:MAG: glucose-6-phosphate dehydrogenase assembly protein OpcA, partial [Verrucomicrobiales bacterium]|nr:glucose-6-phosphate dehydrogenase assembly protein OpcA [Verrucomicrobiales bacterium]
MSASQHLSVSLGNPVEVGKIAGALRGLWDTNDAVTKASLINFAIYSECENCLETNSTLISEITADHACRAIIIAAKPGSTGRSINSWITAHCQLGDGGRKSVCSEQIAFQIEGATADLIRNIVFAHLESDLPLVFWWQGDFTPVFEDRLYSFIDRLIIDSACWSDPANQVDHLCSARSDRASHFVLYDLNWA